MKKYEVSKGILYLIKFTLDTVERQESTLLCKYVNKDVLKLDLEYQDFRDGPVCTIEDSLYQSCVTHDVEYIQQDKDILTKNAMDSHRFRYSASEKFVSTLKVPLSIYDLTWVGANTSLQEWTKLAKKTLNLPWIHNGKIKRDHKRYLVNVEATKIADLARHLVSVKEDIAKSRESIPVLHGKYDNRVKELKDVGWTVCPSVLISC